MQPQHPNTMSRIVNTQFVGGFERFDLYVGRFAMVTYVHAVWGPTLDQTATYTVRFGRLRLKEFPWRPRDPPTEQERDGITLYLHLFVPDLNLEPPEAGGHNPRRQP